MAPLVHITVEIYSGRENPAWTLTRAQAAEFRNRLAGLQPGSTGSVSATEGLGYRGVHVVAGSGGSVQSMMVATERVHIVPPSLAGHCVFGDPGRNFEKWLLHTGGEHLAPELLEYLTRE